MPPDACDPVRRAYDQVAEAYAVQVPDLGVETAPDRAVLDDFAARCARTALRQVLDVGCGTGRVTAYLASLGLDVAGTDLSPGMVDVARRTHPRLRFRVQPMQELDAADASVDGVLACYSLIHTAPDRLLPALAGFARVLRPGGWFLTGFQAGDGERVDRSTAYGHDVDLTNHLHSPDHVTGLLATVGLQVEAVVHRAAEGRERSPQAMVLARRPASDADHLVGGP